MDVRISLSMAALAVVVATTPAVAGEAAYDKGFVIKDGDFKLKTQGRVQTRYTWDAEDVGDETENSQHFAIQRARLKLSGNAFSKALKFKFQADWGKGGAALKDFAVTYVFEKKVLQVTLGQFKRNFSRHQLTSSGKLALIDRAITDKALPSGRDIGFTVGNGKKGVAFEWSVGVFNGTGDKARFVPKIDSATGEVTGGKFSNVPDDFKPAIVARAAYNHGKIKGYSDADLEGGGLRFSVAGNSYYDANATNDEDPVWIGGVDYALKASGFSSVGGFYIDTTKDAEGKAFFAQAGYLVSDRYQPVARHAQIMADEGDAKKVETTLGLSVYFFGHNAKLQADYSLLDTTDSAGEETNDKRLRAQLQLAF